MNSKHKLITNQINL